MMQLIEPSNIYKIHKLSNIPIQNVDYWVRKLEHEGVVLCDRAGEQNRYFLQPLFYESDFAHNFDKVFSNLYTLVNKKVEVLDGQDKTKNTFYTLLSIFHVIARREEIE